MTTITAEELIHGDRVDTLLQFAEEHTRLSPTGDTKYTVEKSDISLLMERGATYKKPTEQLSGVWVMELQLEGRIFVYNSFDKIEVPLHLAATR